MCCLPTARGDATWLSTTPCALLLQPDLKHPGEVGAKLNLLNSQAEEADETGAEE